MKNVNRVWERLLLTINRIIDIDSLLVLYQTDETIDRFMTKQYTRHKQSYVQELGETLGKNIENPYLETVQFAEKHQLINELATVLEQWKKYDFLKRSEAFHYASNLVKTYRLHHQKNYALNFDREMASHLFDQSTLTNNHKSQVVPKLQIEYVG